MRAFAVLLAALALAGCVSVDVDASLTCDSGLTSTTTAELVFGRNIGETLGVSDGDWKAFVDAEVSPRFPDGLTVYDAAGQWRGTNGVLIAEPSKLLLLVLSGAPGEADKIEAIRAAYKARFRQESVLLTSARPAWGSRPRKCEGPPGCPGGPSIVCRGCGSTLGADQALSSAETEFRVTHCDRGFIR